MNFQNQNQVQLENNNSFFTIKGLLRNFADPAAIRLIAEISGILFIYSQLLFIRTEQNFDILITFFPIVLYTIYKIIDSVWISCTNVNVENLAQYKTQNSVINWTILFLYESTIILKILVPVINCVFINIPFLIGLIAKIIYIHAYWEELISLENLVVNVCRYCSIGLSINISLKLDDLLDLSWTSIFWYFHFANK